LFSAFINLLLTNIFDFLRSPSLTFTMAENKSIPAIEEPSEAADVPGPLPHRPTTLKKQVTQNPILSAANTNIPVTPGIHLGAYNEDPVAAETETESYFTEGFRRFNSMAQSPSEAASGAKSNQEVLRRMSLSSGRERQDSLSDVDPRAAHPSLGLTGGIISATFCIQHSLQYRKNADWVSENFISSDT
jgi:hypothetical protein